MGKDLDLDDVAAEHPLAAAELAELRGRISELREIEHAAAQLVNAKGRFHTEQAFNALKSLLAKK